MHVAAVPQLPAAHLVDLYEGAVHLHLHALLLEHRKALEDALHHALRDWPVRLAAAGAGVQAAAGCCRASHCLHIRAHRVALSGTRLAVREDCGVVTEEQRLHERLDCLLVQQVRWHGAFTVDSIEAEAFLAPSEVEVDFGLERVRHDQVAAALLDLPRYEWPHMQRDAHSRLRIFGISRVCA
jgi:hypothetical protein